MSVLGEVRECRAYGVRNLLVRRSSVDRNSGAPTEETDLSLDLIPGEAQVMGGLNEARHMGLRGGATIARRASVMPDRSG
ncbi:hypothetical protein AB6N24_08640 [Cellulomonas sp. 179-A 4D5 NHS]|uniref:hypothetical protein n=1 Tax=Cellulomonas sp. 179-A 4D5 NHS TaxID=3142378 RepID=UPI00399F089C